MKHLVLIRHAHAKPPQPGQCDFDRPLSRRGEREARAAGKAVRDTGNPQPGTILCSSSARTQETARIIAMENGLPESAIRGEHRLYLGTCEDLAHAIATLPDSDDSAVLVGHNPSISDMARLYAGDGLPDMPTGGIVEIPFPVNSWTQTMERRWPE